MKKSLSFLLVVIMLFSSLTVLVHAQTVDVTTICALPDIAESGAHTQAEAVSWLKNKADNNTALDYDGMYGAQCVDLIAYYLNYLGMTSLIGGNAKDYINKTMPSGSGWTKYTNTSNFTPKPGDICVWGANKTYDGVWSTGEYGHIGVVYSVSGSKFTSVEQNVDRKQYCQYINNHSFSAVNAYIRPNFSSSSGNSYAPWDNVYADGITETNAVLHGHVSSLQTITSVGVQVGTSSGNLKLWCEDIASSFIEVWFDLNKYGKTLQPGTTYYYRFFFYNGANYLKLSEIKSFTTSKRSITKTTITLNATSYTYDGTAKQPSVVVKDGSTTLTNGTHYTVAYSNNTNVGTATVTISGKGSYNGSTTKNFIISAKQISNTNIILGETSYDFDGTEKKPDVTVTDGSKSLVVGTDYTLTYANNVNAGTASVTITGKGNYTGSSVKYFTISELPTEPPSVAPTEAPTLAPDEPYFEVVSERAMTGDQVNVGIAVRNNPGITSLSVKVEFPEELILTSVTYPQVFSSFATGSNKMQSPFTVSWFSGTSTDEDVNDIFAIFTFTVSDSAVVGDYPITLTYDEDNVFDSGYNNISFEVKNGAVTVYDHIPGDVNGDTKVNMKDIVFLQQYINGWEVELREDFADVNGDSKVNMKDVVLLQQFINGWEVTLR